MDIHKALIDLGRAVAEFRIWRILAMRTFGHSYRRTVLGPLWHSLDQFLYTLCFAILSTWLFGGRFVERFAYVGIGIAVFNALTQTALTTLNSLVGSTALRNSGLSFSGRILRDLLVVTTTFGFRLVPLLVVLPLLGFQLTKSSFLVFPMILLCVIGGLAVGLQMSIAYCRFRDLEPFVNLVLRLAFFASPVFWHPAVGAQPAALTRLTDWNVFAHYLTIVRAPILGDAPPINSIWFISTFTVLALISAVFTLASTINRILYWLG